MLNLDTTIRPADPNAIERSHAQERMRKVTNGVASYLLQKLGEAVRHGNVAIQEAVNSIPLGNPAPGEPNGLEIFCSSQTAKRYRVQKAHPRATALFVYRGQNQVSVHIGSAK
jgi:hypothetical protein